MWDTYFTFKGRLNRKSYWMRTLAIAGLWLVVVILMVLASFTAFAAGGFGVASVLVKIFYIAFVVVTTWVSVALAARRLHDCGLSGWWQLVLYVPALLVSSVTPLAQQAGFGNAFIVVQTVSLILALVSIFALIWLLYVLGFRKGSVGENRFGPDPLAPQVGIDAE